MAGSIEYRLFGLPGEYTVTALMPTNLAAGPGGLPEDASVVDAETAEGRDADAVARQRFQIVAVVAAVAVTQIEQDVGDMVVGDELPKAVAGQLGRQERRRPHREKRVRPRLPVGDHVVTVGVGAQPVVDPSELSVFGPARRPGPTKAIVYA